MCLEKVTKTWNGSRKKEIAYKVALVYYDDKFGPLYQNKHERWEIGQSYRARYNNIDHVLDKKAGKKIFNGGGYVNQLFSKLVNFKRYIPMIWDCIGESEYPCGFHFFWFIDDAICHRDYARSLQYRDRTYVVLECEISEVVASGEQWEKDVAVARKMKILRVIEEHESAF